MTLFRTFRLGFSEDEKQYDEVDGVVEFGKCGMEQV